MPKVVPEYKEEARKRILDTATKLFLEKGYKKTKMTEIARVLGVSKGALYQYYNSKEELLLEVIKSGTQFRRSSLFNELSSNQLSDISNPIYFTKMVSSTDQMNQLGVEVASAALHNKELLQGLRSFYQSEVDVVQNYFESLKENGLVRPDINSRLIAVSILSLRTGLRGFITTEDDIEVIHQAWKKMLDLLLKDIQK
jgi:AcrR family transcriptional regulator